MRLNQYVAHSTGMSRRKADLEIEAGHVLINNLQASLGSRVNQGDTVSYRGKILTHSLENYVTILFHKPTGLVCSRSGQGNRTIYELLPKEFHGLKPVGRLDKDSSGLLILTSDGTFANQMTHPRYLKQKKYVIRLNKPLQPLHQQMVSDYGVVLDDGPSKFILQKLSSSAKQYEATLSEGRNRQIRRTFSALGYNVVSLHRTQFGNFQLGKLKPGDFRKLANTDTSHD